MKQSDPKAELELRQRLSIPELTNAWNNRHSPIDLS